MVKVTTYNSADEIVADKLANKTAAELVKMWKETDRMINALKFNPTAKDRDDEWDAVIQLRAWMMKAMQKVMTDAEFCKVVGV
jgi:hypothetical protein